MVTVKCDICVIGAGSGGLSFAAGAVQMGANVVLVERNKMGGDCLNYGCIPSKSLLAAAKMAAHVKQAGAFGIDVKEFSIDFAKVNTHIKDVISQIEPHDSEERFEKLGVKVMRGDCSFESPTVVTVNGQHIEAKYFVIATGSRPFVPPIPGVDEIDYLTNETIFELTECPKHLVVIGGGPIGVEMAQAHARLGAQVTVISATDIMPRDDREAVDIVRKSLLKDGIILYEQAIITNIKKGKSGVQVLTTVEGTEIKVAGTHLLMATGRKANVEGLNLEAAKVEYTSSGVGVDERLRSTNKRVFAIGDVAGGLMFTHVAGYHASVALQNILFKLPVRANAAIPWVTYTDPELAHIGLTEEDAKARSVPHSVLKFPFVESDRARAERQTEGFIKVIVDDKKKGRDGRVLGVTIVGQGAGELLLPWVNVVQKGVSLSVFASTVAPYPTFSEVSKRVAGSFYTPKLFSKRTRKLVRFLMKFFS